MSVHLNRGAPTPPDKLFESISTWGLLLHPTSCSSPSQPGAPTPPDTLFQSDHVPAKKSRNRFFRNVMNPFPGRPLASGTSRGAFGGSLEGSMRAPATPTLEPWGPAALRGLREAQFTLVLSRKNAFQVRARRKWFPIHLEIHLLCMSVCSLVVQGFRAQTKTGCSTVAALTHVKCAWRRPRSAAGP